MDSAASSGKQIVLMLKQTKRKGFGNVNIINDIGEED